jgi:hypothetical protein
VERFGKRWSELGKQLKRSENSIKNRFFSLNLLKRKLKRSFDNPEGPSPEPTNMTSEEEENQRAKPPIFSPPCDPSKLCGFRLVQPGETFNIIEII